MQKNFSPNATPAPRRVKHSRRQDVQGKEPISALACPKCGAVFYKKRWQWNPDLLEKFEKDKDKHEICPACKTTKKEEAEGVIHVAGFVSQEQKEEILKLVKNVGERATKRDPLDRIFTWDDKEWETTVYTTENQLAVSIGKQIKRAYNGELDIKWTHEGDVVRVVWKGWT
ncbi:MAG: hypothetical protein ACD_63C00001G0005 [uncultured bacterium]|nr:MAG: hypothetical protein ACD_63C00001G0005 [uncultured bacterium]